MQVPCMKQGTQSRCSGTTQRDGVGKEVGRGFRMGGHMCPDESLGSSGFCLGPGDLSIPPEPRWLATTTLSHTHPYPK